jgi:hypothetical protein
MKRISVTSLLAASLLTLASCGNNEASKSTSDKQESLFSSEMESTQESADTSEEQTIKGEWEDTTKELLIKYCGEVLPYPNDMAEGLISAEESVDSNKTPVLKLKDEATSFSLLNYYADLTEDGWNLISDYGSSASRKDSNGTVYYELTKGDEKSGKGYDIIYFYDPGVRDTKWVDGRPSGNIMWCYNDLTANRTSNADWSESEASTIFDSLSDDLPFIALGENYVTYQYSSDDLLIYDSSTFDLREEYAKALENDGYTTQEEESKENGVHTLTKTLADGSTITAYLSFSCGNFFEFVYSPFEKTSTTWPKDAFAKIEKEVGFSIPVFEADDIEEYVYYVKNDTVGVYALTEEISDISFYYNAELDHLGMSSDFYGNFLNWEENLSIYAGSLPDETGCEIGYQVIVSLVEPTSSFSSSWPSLAISDYLTSLNVNVACPSPSSLPTSKKIKYVIEDDYDYWYDYYLTAYTAYPDYIGAKEGDSKAIEEAAAKAAKQECGLFITIDDPSYKAYDAYYSFMKGQLYHTEEIENGVFLYEDPTGELAITLEATNYTSKITIKEGSGVAHKPSLAFSKEKVTIGLGESQELEVISDMLPESYSFSSSDASGNVTVDENGLVAVSESAIVGETSTITVSCLSSEGVTYTATCFIEIAEKSPITPYEAIDQAVELLNAYLGYTEDIDKLKATHSSTGDFIEDVYLGSKTVAELKKDIKANLIPSGFALEEDWKTQKDQWGNVTYLLTYKSGEVNLVYSLYYFYDTLYLKIAASNQD